MTTLNRIDEIRGDDTRSAWLQRLIDRELNGQPATQTATGGPVTLPADEPSPGAICATPACWQRDTRAYGLRQLPLCPACHAALQGHEHKRPTPPGAARLTRRGTA